MCVCVFFCLTSLIFFNQAIKKMSIPSRLCGWLHREGEGADDDYAKTKIEQYYELHNVSLGQSKFHSGVSLP